MKPKILILVFLLSASLISFSQTAKEQKLMDKLCKEACNEINKTDFSDKDEKKDTEMKLGLALLPVFNNNAKEIKSVYGLDVTNPADVGLIGEKLGAALVYKCDKFQTIALRLAQKEEEKNTSENQAPGNTTSVQGYIEKIDCTDLCVVYFKTESDETIRLFWMEKFAGSEILEKFTASDKSKIKKVSYRETVVYQPKTKSYQTIKVVTGIE